MGGTKSFGVKLIADTNFHRLIFFTKKDEKCRRGEKLQLQTALYFLRPAKFWDKIRFACKIQKIGRLRC